MPDPDYGIIGTTPGTGAPVEHEQGTGQYGIVGTTPATGRAAPPRGHPLDNAPDDSAAASFAKNTGTGALRMLSHIPGFFGDAVEMGHFVGSNVASILPGEKRTAAEIREGHAKSNALDRDLLASTHGPTSTARRAAGTALNAATPSSGSELYEKYVAPHLGEYKPESLVGRIYQGGLEGALPIPGGKTKAVTSAVGAAPGMFSRALDIARRATTSSAGTGAIMGGTATGVGEILGPAWGIGASLAVPFGVKKLGPRPTSYDKAADKTYGALHDPTDAMRELDAARATGYRDAAGSPMTTAEASRDKNLAGVQKGHESTPQGENFSSSLNDIRGEQAQNRQGQLAGLSHGDSAKVSETARQMRDDIHAKAEADTATQQRLSDMLAGPEAAARDATGKSAIDIRDTNNERARAAVTKLYGSIDPNNSIHVDLSSVKATGAEILASLDPRKHLPSPEAEKVLEMARDLPPTWGFNDLVDFDKTVGQARWKASQAGDAHGAKILKKLQDHMDQVRDGSLDRRAAWEKEAVQRGELKPDQTIEAALERQRAAADIAGTGRRDIAASSGAAQPVSTGTPPAPVGERTGPATPHPAGGTEVPGGVLSPEEYAAAAARQDLAKQGHALRMRTFEEGPVGAFPEGDKTLYGNVPASAFAAGPTGAQKMRAWLTAGADNPEMLNSIKSMALNELHGMMEDGVVTTKTLDKWRAKYASALSEIDRHEPGFSKSFDANAAQHQKLLDTIAAGHEAKTTFAKSQAAKMLGLEHPHEVDAHVAQLMGDKKGGAQRLRSLMDQLAAHPDAQEGVRAAAVKWLVDKANSRELISQPGGARVNASAPGNYIKALENAQPHMEAVFGRDGFDAAKLVAEEMKRTKEAIDARIVRGGSDTAKNQARAKNAQALVDYLNEAGGPSRMNYVEGVAVMEALHGLGEGLLAGDVVRGLVHAVAFLGVRQGLHMFSARMAAKEGKGLRESGDLIRAALLDPATGHEMLKHGAARAAAESRAAPKTVEALRAGNIAAAERQRTDGAGPPSLPSIFKMFDRQGRASGGSVGTVDHARHASRMVRMVSKVRDELGRETKPLLNVHDNAIASALANARSMAS